MGMKILIIGAAGLLGKELARDFSEENEVLGADTNTAVKGVVHLDLLQKEELKDAFLRFKPGIVLLPAAVNAVDAIEKDRDLAWRVNVEGTKEVAVLARKAGAFMTIYSTDYIFDGKDGPYPEEFTPNPLNFYGKTKLEGERIITKELKRFLIIRTCSIYGYEKDGKNYAMQVLNSLSAKKAFRAVNDQFGTPTYAADLSRVTLELIRSKKEGVFNVVGPDYVNRVQFASAVAEVFGLDKGLIIPVATRELNQPAQRPAKGGLKIEKLAAELGIKTMSLKDGLIAMKEEMAING